MAKTKLKEGQVLELRYVKDIFLNEEYMVFENEFKERYTLPAIHYKSYHIRLNQLVKCLITKVNCNGKVSFEPEHPYYKLGQIYDFKFLKVNFRIEKRYNPVSRKNERSKEYELVVLDLEGNEHKLEPLEHQKRRNFKTAKIKCKLVRIVKGYFQLINLG